MVENYLPQDGLVTANAEGVTQIIAEASNGVVGIFSIQSYTAAESITLETKELSMTVGESFDPGATVSPANVSHSLQWSSSEPGVASVDENGLIQAYAAGTTILRAEIDGVLAEIYVSVFDSPLTVTTYQSNTNGDQLKVDIINRSQNFFTGTIIVAIYNNGQCLYSNSIAISLAAQDKMQQYLTLNALASGDDYTVKAFVLNEKFAPTQTCSQGVIIG